MAGKAADAPMGWGKIVVILLGVALVAGLVMGLVGELLGLSGGATGGGIGGATGVTAAYLIMRRKAALEAQARRRT